MKPISAPPSPEFGPGGRLVSLDVFRGVTMFLLIGEATALYEKLVDPALHSSLVHAIGLVGGEAKGDAGGA